MHFEQLMQFLPEPAIEMVLVLFLGFLVGLEREERKASDGHYSFGGVRTYPLIALIGYTIALLKFWDFWSWAAFLCFPIGIRSARGKPQKCPVSHPSFQVWSPIWSGR
jgi:hypothetical protein